MERVKERNYGTLYHGSPVKNWELKAMPSALVGNESVIYATNRKDIAAFFAARVSDKDIEFGSVNGKLYALEKYEGAFKKLEVPAYIHAVSAETFVSDKRLGMRQREFISRESSIGVKAIEIVPSVYEYLRSRSHSKINLITWGEMIEKLEPLMLLRI